jgi:hypothetical protein
MADARQPGLVEISKDDLVTLGAPTAVLPTLVVDPVDYLLVDLATGRHLPGDTIHVEQLAFEHGLSSVDAGDALAAASCLGLVSFGGSRAGALVTWSPLVSQSQLHRLARAMVTAVGTVSPRDPYGVDVIDGEQNRLSAVELFDLQTPCDVELFLELARALLSRRSIAVIDELVVPIAVLFSATALRVHGLELAADDDTRQQIVCGLVRSLMDGDVEAFGDLMADYVVAMSID